MFEQRLKSLENEIAKSNIDHRKITVVGVTKYTEIDKIDKIINGQLENLAENKVQRLILLRDKMPSTKLHLIGHLQTNKVKNAVLCADLIQSVDSAKILCEISKESKKINKIQDILIQVNIAHEERKFGLIESDAEDLIKKALETENIRLRGLMTIMPIEFNEDHYKKMEDFYKNLQIKYPQLNILSMGMTNDFATAVKYGSNMVRVGTYLFK